MSSHIDGPIPRDQLRTQLYIHACVWACISVYRQLYVYTCVCMCVRVCVCVCKTMIIRDDVMNFEEDTDRGGKEEADAVCMHEVPKEYFFKKK